EVNAVFPGLTVGEPLSTRLAPGFGVTNIGESWEVTPPPVTDTEPIELSFCASMIGVPKPTELSDSTTSFNTMPLNSPDEQLKRRYGAVRLSKIVVSNV